MPSFLNKLNRVVQSHRIANRLKSSQYNKYEIQTIQRTKLCNMLNFCRQHIKYYKEEYRDLGTIGCLQDLNNIPILTKEKIRQRFWDFLPNELPACRVYRTSGSSGIPLCILSDESSRLNNSAAIIRYRKRYGLKAFATAILTPLKKQSDQVPTPHWTWVQGFHKTYYVNPYVKESKRNDQDINTLKRLRSPALIGITPAIKALAHQINDEVYPSITPVAVLTVGESLSQETRSFLEMVYKVRVYDTYACSEAGDIAWQCPDSLLYHINAENIILEILDKENKPVGEGEVGEVVITNLNRYSMPFIRYKNGDMARAHYKGCPCGCELPMIKEIIGRSGEDFYLPDRKKMPWNVLKSAMNHNLIRQFQLIQNPDASVTVKYVPEQLSRTTEIEAILKDRFSNLLPNSLPISYEVVSKIPPSPSGKSKLVICNYRL